jgi:hypothetical protein
MSSRGDLDFTPPRPQDFIPPSVVLKSLYNDDFSKDSSKSSISSARRIRPPVPQEITSDLKNAIVTDSTLNYLSAKAKNLILKLLADIEKKHAVLLQQQQAPSSELNFTSVFSTTSQQNPIPSTYKVQVNSMGTQTEADEFPQK